MPEARHPALSRALAAALGLAAAAGAVALAVDAWWPVSRPPPNVLILLWDTTRADRMSLYGGHPGTTPRIEAWARTSGVVFDEAVAPDMWTVPTHASLFTGLPARTHGAGVDHRWLDDGFVTLAESLAADGYDTYAFSANPNLAPRDVNLLQGFHWIDTSWGEGPWVRAAAAVTRNKLLRQDASTEISPANPRRAQGGLAFNAGPVAHRAFVDWLDTAHRTGRPWFAYLSYMEAHKPRVPSARARRRVADDAVNRKALATDFTFDRQLRYTYGLDEFDAAELAAVRATYDATLADLDDATADLLADLDARGLLEDTVVILTADHGEQLGEHHRFGHRQGLDQALVHVPLVVSWRGTLEPRRVATPVSTAGLPYTVATLLGRAPPSPEATPLDWLAETLPATVFSESLGWDRPAFLRMDRAAGGRLEESVFARTWGAVRRGPWWLVESRAADGAGVEVHLYDAHADPAETTDLASSRPELVAELRAALAARDAATPAAAPAEVGEGPDEATRRDLELLGYLEGDQE